MWYPYRYILFPTVNKREDKPGACFGLSMYWARERETTNWTLEDSQPDNERSRLIQEMYECQRSENLNFEPRLTIRSCNLSVRGERWNGWHALIEAQDYICSRRGSFIMTIDDGFYICQAVAVHRRHSEDVGYFHPSH